MTDLSQAERTAIKAYVDSHGTGTHQMFLNGAEAGWRRGRDYGRERERALTEALSRLLNASRDILPYEKKGPVNELIEAETHADEVLADGAAKLYMRVGESNG